MKKLFALELAVELYQLSKDLKLPMHLKNQYVRACSSIALNLAEGSAKLTQADRKKFYFIALGSLRECQTILRFHDHSNLILARKIDFLGVCLYKLCWAVK